MTVRFLAWAVAVLAAFAGGWYLGGRNLDPAHLAATEATRPGHAPGSLAADEPRTATGTGGAIARRGPESVAEIRSAWRARLERLEVLSRGGEHEDAAAAREEMLETVLELGREGGPALARELLEAYLARNPHDADAHLLDSDLLQMQGRLEEAMTPLLELLAFADDPPAVAGARDKLRLLVNVQETQLANAGDLAALIRLFEDLTLRDPGFDGHRLRLAHWLLRAGRLAEAERLLAETGFVGADPESREQLVGAVQLARTGLPLTREGGALHVNAQVAGRPLRMLVDTGATMTAISRGEAAALGAASTGERVRVRTAGGVMEAFVHRVRDVEIGALHLDSLTVLVIDGPLPQDVDGLLGMDVLAHFQSLPGTSLPLPERPGSSSRGP